ncbi:MAG: isoprenylcysteine carboxylmethyltransferase family protein [Oscillospiraceae bacterium]|nr:isoprenylcysteine carboxylmethyltransferase family protein [Oscillospiraceae bacterium]
MKKQDHLPVYGVGPIYVCVIAVLTLAAFLMRKLPAFASGRTEELHVPLLILGSVFILSGVALWVFAVPVSKIDDGIRENRLVTSGAYALVRNPIYSAAMIACTGVILTAGNAWFFVLPLLYWLFMTVLVKATEEKWLRALYGAEYEDYCRRVNRCWPGPQKRRKR